MRDLDLASFLFGNDSSTGSYATSTDSSLVPGRTRTYTATALADSEDGYVEVRVEGSAVTDGSDSIILPTQACVKEGDVVNVTVVNGVPTVAGAAGWGDRQEASILAVESVASSAEELAEEAKALSEATGQHFWDRSEDSEGDGAGTGAFVTDVEQDDFLEHINDPTETRPLHNLLMNAEGILLRAAKKIRAAFTPSGVAFYDGNGNNAANIVASFGSSGATIGKSSTGHASVTSSGLEVFTNANTSVASFGSTSRIGDSSAAHVELDSNQLRFKKNTATPVTILSYSNSSDGGVVKFGEHVSVSGDGIIGTDEFISASLDAGDSDIPNSQGGTVYSEIHAQTSSKEASIRVFANGSINGIINGNYVASLDNSGLTLDKTITAHGGGYMRGASMRLNCTNFTDGTTVTTAGNGNSRLVFLDNNGSNIGWLDTYFATSGEQRVRLYAYRNLNGVEKYCGLMLGTDSSGNPTVTFTGTGAAAAWRSALGLDVATHSPTLSNATATTFETRRSNNVVNLSVYQLKLLSALANGSSVSLGTGIIGSNARPTNVVYLPLVANVAGFGSGVLMSIGTGGNVTVYNRSGSSLGTGVNLMGNTTWVI